MFKDKKTLETLESIDKKLSNIIALLKSQKIKDIKKEMINNVHK